MRFPLFCVPLISLFSGLFAAECEFSLVDSAAVISIEGRFVNREFSRVGIDLIWQRTQLADTFDIVLSGSESFRYVSSPDFRYMEYRPENVRRQMATHHLKENIGNSPLLWDDLELLARFLFRCPDSLPPDSNLFQTTRSAAWKSVAVNSKIRPDSITMKSYRNEIRTLFIHRWANFNGIFLPSSFDIASGKDSGSLWIRSVQRQGGAPKPRVSTSPFFQKLTETGLKDESEVPFVLQMH